MRSRRRSAALALAVLVAVVPSAACTTGGAADGGSAAPSAPTAGAVSARPVTADESEVLAVVRFRNFDAGTRSVRATYEDQGHEVGLQGWFDYATHTGYVTVSTDGVASDAVVWDGARIAIAPAPPAQVPGVPPASVEGWSVAPLDPTASRVGALLAVLARLGADRPENPLLLRQGGALWLRDDEVDGRPVTVFAGPTQSGTPSPGAGGPEGDATEGPGAGPDAASAAPGGATVDPDAAGVRYWVDETGLALRVEVRLGASWATVDLGDGQGVTVAPLPAGAGPAPTGEGDG